MLELYNAYRIDKWTTVAFGLLLLMNFHWRYQDKSILFFSFALALSFGSSHLVKLIPAVKTAAYWYQTWLVFALTTITTSYVLHLINAVRHSWRIWPIYGALLCNATFNLLMHHDRNHLGNTYADSSLLWDSYSVMINIDSLIMILALALPTQLKEWKWKFSIFH